LELFAVGGSSRVSVARNTAKYLSIISIINGVEFSQVDRQESCELNDSDREAFREKKNKKS
jgi:hypothetical protein